MFVHVFTVDCRAVWCYGCAYYLLFLLCWCFFFFFNDTATTEIYTLSLHDALPIYHRRSRPAGRGCDGPGLAGGHGRGGRDRKSTRLNSSHSQISYAVFCLKKKNKHHKTPTKQQPSSATRTPAPATPSTQPDTRPKA